jgi:uncharacterized protein
MQTQPLKKIAAAIGARFQQVRATLALIEEGATVPFIARYRKEATGGLDEVAITVIRDLAVQMAELDNRRAVILKSLARNGHLSEVLEHRIKSAETLSSLEDIYLPYRPKRRTRAMIAKEKGLEPLAEALFAQTGTDPLQLAAQYIDPAKAVASIEAALSGARDLMAEWINENEDARAALRQLFFDRARLTSRLVKDKALEGANYRDYFEWSEPAARAPSHRVLAIRRGEKADILNMSILPPEAEAIGLLKSQFVSSAGADGEQVGQAVVDAYKRLLSRAMETEMRLATKARADNDAIKVFAANLRQLLLAPPLGAKRVMGVDPGFRSGCKLACLDRQGQLVHHETVHPHASQRSAERAATSVEKLCQRYSIEAIAVGNGTASRETEAFFRELSLENRPPVVIVNESGASVYSASEIARQEFPDLDLTFRGAVSIGRRLMDPLAELVKIDPKSIGVGQYQHDVDQVALKQALDDVVSSCVNHVGVDVNRASVQLLTYVSGLGPRLAEKIVSFRNANGPFRNRDDLKQVPRLGPKAFEQAAGFLKILDGDNPLDASAVHPESYSIVHRMAVDLDCRLDQLLMQPELRRRIDPRRYASDRVGLPTLMDILAELDKPGRDPRSAFEPFAFDANIREMADLTVGMKLPGIVTNITAFGAFVDVGVHQDGLVHISELADRYVADPQEIVSVNQQVVVTVLEIDMDRKRIALSMKVHPGKSRMKDNQSPSAKMTPSNCKASGERKSVPRRPFHNPFQDTLTYKD